MHRKKKKKKCIQYVNHQTETETDTWKNPVSMKLKHWTFEHPCKINFYQLLVSIHRITINSSEQQEPAYPLLLPYRFVWIQIDDRWLNKVFMVLPAWWMNGRRAMGAWIRWIENLMTDHLSNINERIVCHKQ